MHTRVAVVVFALCTIATASAETPHDLALRIIAETPAPIYQSRSISDDQLDLGTVTAARAQFREFMLSRSVPDDVRVCYAIDVLDSRIALAHGMSSSQLAQSYRDDLARNRAALVSYLRQRNSTLSASPPQAR